MECYMCKLVANLWNRECNVRAVRCQSRMQTSVVSVVYSVWWMWTCLCWSTDAGRWEWLRNWLLRCCAVLDRSMEAHMRHARAWLSWWWMLDGSMWMLEASTERVWSAARHVQWGQACHLPGTKFWLFSVKGMWRRIFEERADRKVLKLNARSGTEGGLCFWLITPLIYS